MQVPQCGEVVDREVEAAEAFGAIGTELAPEHEEGIVVHCRLLKLSRRRVEIEACDRHQVEGALVLEAADELGIRLLAKLFPAVESLAGVGLEKPDEERLAVTPATMEEENLAERVVFVELSQPEERDDGVADELLGLTAVAPEDRLCDARKSLQDPVHRLRIEELSEAG